MAQTLPQLEQHRQHLYRKLEEVGDLRPGMISVRYRKCGKGNCLCAHKRHAVHGPQYLWNTTQGGKSRAENLHLGRNLEKARQEVENYQRITGLCRQLVEVNEQICQLRPVPGVADAEALELLKKNSRGAMRGDRAGTKRAGKDRKGAGQSSIAEFQEKLTKLSKEPPAHRDTLSLETMRL